MNLQRVYFYVYARTLVDRSIIWMGAQLVVRYMRYANEYPAQAYVNGADAGIRVRFIALATQMSEVGRLPDGTYGHFLKGEWSKIYQFKPGRGRVFGFFHDRNVYITNGADKKKIKEQEKDYEEAKRLRDDFYANLVPRRRAGN